MQNNELAEIDASIRAIVRRAYDLGRSEALKKVVDVLKADCPSLDQLALMAPDENARTPNEAAANDQEPSAKGPWWAWPIR